MTPVQIPFKRNFKDMENKFEYLKIDGREQLPAPWSDYPVDYLDALVGQQDGWWVAGVHMEVGGSGGGFNPGRKWGQFATRENALLWALGRMLCHEKLRGAARQAVLDRIDNIRQLTLF